MEARRTHLGASGDLRDTASTLDAPRAPPLTACRGRRGASGHPEWRRGVAGDGRGHEWPAFAGRQATKIACRPKPRSSFLAPPPGQRDAERTPGHSILDWTAGWRAVRVRPSTRLDAPSLTGLLRPPLLGTRPRTRAATSTAFGTAPGNALSSGGFGERRNHSKTSKKDLTRLGAYLGSLGLS